MSSGHNLDDRVSDRRGSTGGLPRTLVLMGGPDAERPVSLASGRAVAEALRTFVAAAGDVDPMERIVDRIIDRPDEADLRSLIDEVGAEVVMPILHGPWGEGGPLQEILERIGVPFVGSGSVAARLAMDKVATKSAAQQLGIPTPPARILETLVAPELDVLADIEPPVVIKPIDDGSSVGVFVCRDRAEIDAARHALRDRSRLLVERFVEGREITLGMVADRILPPIEIRPLDGLYDYEAKYVRDDTQYIVDPPLSPALAESIRASTREILQRLGIRDLARVDFIVDERTPWLLEVNSIPGFTDHSLVPKAARAVGIEMPPLCATLVERGHRRGPRRAPVTGSEAISPPS